jgi:hypothetical protein
MTCPAHMSHLFPVIDVVLFRRVQTLKKYLARTRPRTGRDHLVRILRG